MLANRGLRRDIAAPDILFDGCLNEMPDLMKRRQRSGNIGLPKETENIWRISQPFIPELSPHTLRGDTPWPTQTTFSS